MIIKTGKLTRQAEVISVSRDPELKENRVINLAFSSEEPVDRSFGTEILDHDLGSVDMEFMGSGRTPLLVDHDPSDHIGVVEKASVGTDRVARAQVRFGRSDRANEVFQDVEDGIRSNVSVGYRINAMEKDEDDESDGDVWRVVDWTPMEVSFVSIPADTTVGVGRDADDQFETLVINGGTTMADKETTASPEAETVTRAEPAQVAQPQVDYSKLERQAREAESSRVAEIMALGESKNMRDTAIEAIRDGKTVEQFRGVVIDSLPSAQPIEVNEPELTPAEEKSYSLMRAIRASTNNDWRDAQFEREVSDEIGRLSGKQAKGFFVHGSAWGQRNIIAGTDADGGYLKPVDHYGNEFIGALRSRLVVAGLGTRMLTGLQGDVSIPKLSAGVSAGFVGEGSAVSEANQTFAELALAPKTLGVFTDISRKLMMQSDPSAEAIVRDDILNAVAAKIEDVAIEGDGSNEPTGITKTSGIGSVAGGTNGAAPAWDDIVNLVKEVEVDNASINEGSCAYLSNSKVKAKLASTAKVGSSDSVMILNAPWNELYGYPFAVTNHVPSDLTKGSTSGTCSAIIFGDFSQLIMAFWSNPDVLVDPYTGGSAGNTRIIVHQDIDVGVRHAQSFSAMLDATT